jgi:hypothetical protein
MLSAASSMSPDEIRALPLDLTRDLDYLVGNGSGPLLATLDDIAASDVLRELAPFERDAAMHLRERFLALAQEQSREERKRVIEAPLSDRRVEDLKLNIVRGWHEASYMRDLVTDKGRYEFNRDPPTGLGELSIHRLDRKDLYVDESRFETSTWGLDYGRALSRGEDDLVLDQIVSEVPTLMAEPVEPEAVAHHLQQGLSAIAAVGEPVVLLVGSLRAGWALGGSDRFEHARLVDDEERSGPRVTGYFDGTPVYQIHSDKSFAIAADLRELGIWRQYLPTKRTPASESLDEVILFEMETYTEESARELLRNQPDTFRYIEGTTEQRSDDERLSLVLQSVRVLILEQLRFEVTNPDAARLTRFTE